MVDGPEMKSVYDVANDFKVPVLIHFQEGAFNSGISRMPALLSAYPNLIFLAHANSFWANISADVDDKIDYPTGRIKPGGYPIAFSPTFPIFTAISPPTPAATPSSAIRNSPPPSLSATRAS